MNTPAHLIFAGAAFGRPDRRGSLVAALLGGFAPDASLYAMVSWHLMILETSPRVVFGQLYFSDAWMQVFAVDNSLILWSLLLGLALWRRWSLTAIFAASALFHILLDLPLHAGDGRPHFWPATLWIYDSPLSYWDTDHGAAILGPLELLLSTILVVVLWRRFLHWGCRAGFVALLAAEAASNNVWLFLF